MLYSEVAVPEVEAAAALAEHHPEEVAGLASPATPYVLVSKVPHVLGPASLELKKPQQAVSDFEPGMRYRGFALDEGGGSALQAPDYSLCLRGTARAQARFDKAAAMQTYEKPLDIWKTADRDFIPAQEARKEFAALNALKN